MKPTFYNLSFIIAIVAMLMASQAATAQCTTGLYYYGCTDGDNIESFSTTGGITNISNLNTGCGGGYSGFSYYNQTVTATNGTTINFSLTNNIDYDEYYQIWVDYNNNNNFTDAGENVWTGQVITAMGSTTGSFTIPANVAPGTKRLRVRCAWGETSPITPCGFYYYGETEDYNLQVLGGPCKPVTNLAASNLTLTTATISWDPSGSNPLNYEYRIDNSPNDPPASGYSFTNNTSLQLTGLTHGTCYYIHVRAICDPMLATTEESPWETIQFCTVIDCLPPVVHVEDVKHTTALASWTPVPTEYAYEYAVSRLATPPTNAHTTTYTNILLQGLEPNKAMYLHVRCKCSPTPMSPWTSVPFHTTATVGVQEVNNDNFGMDAYPNPVKDVLNVKVFGEMKGKATIALTDISGRELYSTDVTGNSVEINMKAIPAGIYLLRYTDGQHYNTQKVVKE